jgi:hypothetical protein
MRPRALRTVVVALGFVTLGAGGALVACSGGTAASPGEDSGTPSSDAGALGSPEAGDASVSDATVTSPDGGDASAVGSGGDAGSDGGPEDAAGFDSAEPTYDFGIDGGDCGLGPRGEPTDLGCTGLYADWATKTVAPGLTAYAPGLVLWSDGAEKTRWLALPPGQQIDTSDMDEWTFPVGTRIWKEFRLPVGDASAETRIETRLLWKLKPTLWYRTTYVWSSDGTTSATELTTGEVDAGGTGYEIPNQTRCNQCHNGRKDGVLGIEAVSLSAPGASGLTMAELVEAGTITEPPDASLAVPGNAIESAALGWLHANCGTSCHNRGQGQAENTNFWMRLDVATLATVQATDTYTTGWDQPTIGFPIPDAAVSYRIHQCDLASSAVYFRAGHRDGVNGTPDGTQMPPVDSHVVDTTDLAGVAAWIDEACDAGDGGGDD